jgi:hypothetical protein
MANQEYKNLSFHISRVGFNTFTKYVILFFELFFARLVSKFSKSADVTPPKIFFKNQKRYQKTQNFTLILNPLKKL